MVPAVCPGCTYHSFLPPRNDYTCSSDYCTGCDGNNGNPDYSFTARFTAATCRGPAAAASRGATPTPAPPRRGDCGGCTSSPNCADISGTETKTHREKFGLRSSPGYSNCDAGGDRRRVREFNLTFNI